MSAKYDNINECLRVMVDPLVNIAFVHPNNNYKVGSTIIANVTVDVEELKRRVKLHTNNNYRKIHKLPMNRWANREKARRKYGKIYFSSLQSHV